MLRLFTPPDAGVRQEPSMVHYLRDLPMTRLILLSIIAWGNLTADDRLDGPLPRRV